jgi:hypothetical protein
MARAEAINPHNELRAAEILKASLGDLAKFDDQLLLDTIEGETSLFEMVDALLLADLADDALVDAVAKAKSTLDGRAKAIEARQISRRALLEQAMMVLEQKTLRRPTATLSLAERKPKVIVTDESEVPSRFFKTVPVLDKKAVTAAVEAGEEVPGTALSNATVSISIRRA